MWLIVYNPETSEEYISRRMGPYETMNERKFADQIAGQFECEIDDSDGHIPNCCGDVRVEFRPHKNKSWHIWSGQSFYFKR